MNVNIVLDSDYICNKLNDGEEDIINNLFTYFKNKSNIIIIQDNNKTLLKKIAKHEKISDQNIKNTEIFLTSLINGTNKLDYTVKEKYDNNFINFIKSLQIKDYPIQIIISDKKIDGSVQTFLLDDFDADPIIFLFFLNIQYNFLLKIYLFCIYKLKKYFFKIN